MKQHAVIIFDADCAFCSWCVQIVLRCDKKDYYRFTPLAGEFATAFFKKNNITDTEAIWLIRPDGRYYSHSSAVFRILTGLGGVYRLAFVGLIIPKPLRDWGYKLFSRHRRRFMRNTCVIIPDEHAHKFM